MVPQSHPINSSDFSNPPSSLEPFNKPTVRKPEFHNLEITIILISPETSGNVGAICRIMKNFSFRHLIIFQPICNPLDNDGYGFAMHAKEILESAEIIHCTSGMELQELSKLFKQFEIVIGTSAKGVDKSNITRIPVFLHELDFSLLNNKSKIAIVFGRESTGLTNEEILLTDFCLKISVDEAYPTLNLSQAVAICLYSIFLNLHSIGRGKFTSATKIQKDRLIEIIKNITQNVPIEKFRLNRAIISFKNLFGRAFLTWKEANLIFSFFRKIDYLLAGDIPIRPKVKAYQNRDIGTSDNSEETLPIRAEMKKTNNMKENKKKV
jgi:tRNA/rRNA methyltransferase